MHFGVVNMDKKSRFAAPIAPKSALTLEKIKTKQLKTKLKHIFRF